MNIDLLLTRRSEAGLVCDERISFRPTHAIYDFYEHHLSINGNGSDNSIWLNIPLSSENEEQLVQNLGIHIGFIVNETIEDIIYIPLMISNTGGIEIQRFMPKARSSPTAFEIFMRECASGQAVHREDISSESKSSGILENLSPSVLRFAPTLAHAKQMEHRPNYAPVIAAAPTFGIGGTTASTVMPPSQPTAPANPMAFFHPDAIRKKAEEKKAEDIEKAQKILESSNEKLLEPLMSMIGMEPLKKQIHSIVNLAKTKALRALNLLPRPPVSLHMIFTGAPGTGKTSAAREIGSIMKGLGYLEYGHLVETSPDDMRTRGVAQVIEQAIGGVLFIDEAYSIFEREWEETSNIIPILLKEMEDHRDELIVIAAGYSGEMREFLNSNPGLQSRFSITIDFPNYSAEEMTGIFKKFCHDHHYDIEPAALAKLQRHFHSFNTDEAIKSFGNARGVRNVFEKALMDQAHRLMTNNITDTHEIQLLKSEDVLKEKRDLAAISPEELEELLAPLNRMIGLDNIKKDIADLAHLLHAHIIRTNAGLKTSPVVLHSLFMGPPGTGKTSVARLLGKIYKRLGFCEKGHVVEVDKERLTGKYLGWTAKIASSAFHEAEGGILFIDEAYALSDSSLNGYGNEALTTILKLMEDHRDKVIVICAGYEEEMKEFLRANSGLSSRFPRHLIFKSYSADDLVRIFETICHENNYTPTSEALGKVMKYLTGLSKDEIDKAGNGRLSRNIFEKTIIAQARRISLQQPDPSLISTIDEGDINFPETVSDRSRFGFI